MDNNIFMRFPGGKRKALTLSYDDGVFQDIRLIAIMKENGLKGTFNLNSGIVASYEGEKLHGSIRLTKDQIRELYLPNGMEIACHTVNHPFLEQLPGAMCFEEVYEDRLAWENLTGGMVRGMAYPMGTFSDDVVQILRQCGIVYSRTVVSTEKFDMPKDWLRLPATCHHNNPRLFELAEKFLNAPNGRPPILFYLWGHSYEFDRDDSWDRIEKFAQLMGNRDDIWYATNMEIYEYQQAYRQLIFRCDGGEAYNPTQIPLYIRTGIGTLCVEPGKTMKLK